MISVIIPVYNDPQGLEATLASLVDQDISEPFEIIVADNGSTDNTQKVANDFQHRFPTLVHLVIESEQQGSYAARNKAIKQAKGNLLFFIDADMVAPFNYLEKIAAIFKESDTDYVGCKVDVVTNKKTLAAKYNQLGGFKVDVDLEKNHFVPTCCLSIKKAVIDQVGNFDARLESGGDYEFGNRVHRAGLQQTYIDSVTLKHPARWKYRSLMNKSKRVARGICQLAYYYPDRFWSRYLKYFSLTRHKPKSPWSTMKRAKLANIRLHLGEALILSVFHIPLTISSSKEAKRFMTQLQQQVKSPPKNAPATDQPLVSVNITTYNRANFLGRCLDSVLNQSYQNIEVIVVDDASSDHTSEVAENYCKKDSRVRYFRHDRNQGNAYARNTALRNCQGTFVAFMDDDDEWVDTNKLAKQVKIFSDSIDPKLGIVCSGVKVIDAQDNEEIRQAKMPSNLVSTLLKGNGVIHNSTVMTRRNIMTQVGGFDTKMPRGIDSEFFRTVVVKYGYKVHFMPDITAAYHEHGEERMTTNKKNAAAKTWKANKHVIQKHLRSFLLHPGALSHRVLSRFKKIVAN
ncbi:MAG: glycosyltransferase [Bacteroidota bacterium]